MSTDLQTFKVRTLNFENVYCDMCYDNKVSNNNLCDECQSYCINSLEETDDFAPDQTEYDSWNDMIRQIARSLTSLTPDQGGALLRLIEKYRELFSEKPGCTQIYVHKIKLKVQKAYMIKSYPVPLSLTDAVREEIRKMMSMGVIELSTSGFCNPLRIVMK